MKFSITFNSIFPPICPKLLIPLLQLCAQDLLGQLPCTLDSPRSFASSAAAATRPVIIKQEPGEEPIDQQDWNYNDGTMLPHDFIPVVPIKEERMDGILTDHQHVSAIISFNAM